MTFIKTNFKYEKIETRYSKFDSKTFFKNQEENYYSINLDTFPFKLDKIPKNESFKCSLIKITNQIPGNLYFEKSL